MTTAIIELVRTARPTAAAMRGTVRVVAGRHRTAQIGSGLSAS